MNFNNQHFTLAEINEVVDHIRSRTQHQPTIGMILGTGLSPLAEQIEEADILPYGEIPHFPVSTVHGHAGRLVIGKLAGAMVFAMQGRFHFYEGYTMQQVTLPVRVMKQMGIQTLIVTNAAGGLNMDFQVGDLMVIDDQINFMGMAGQNPLMGPNLEELGPRFPATNRTYAHHLRELADRVAESQGLQLQHGVYVGLSGPAFETPAEVRMLQILGADAVGMSTVPEALVARHSDMDVLGISTITNVAIAEGDSGTEPNHEEVNEAGKIIVPRLSQLLLGVLKELSA